MSYDWKALAPTSPLTLAEVRDGNLYVPRAGEGAREIDALLTAGLDQPIALFGPAGAGKSTELAALAKLREARWFGTLLRLDKSLPFSDATSADDVLDAISRSIIFAIKERGVRLSPELTNFAHSVSSRTRGEGGFDLLLAALREIKHATADDVGLMVDGLEKASSGLAGRTLADLARLRGELYVVVVVPSELATGPGAAALHDYEARSIGPVLVSNDVNELMKGPTEGDRFFFEIAARRLGTHTFGRESWDTTAVAIRRCIVLSGGLIRTFLQLLQKAALYAAMRGVPAPDEEDVARAARDQTAFLVRLLKEGDVGLLRFAHGTSGLEVPIEHRVRFLANGLLLEYRTAAGTLVHVAPLLAKEILDSSKHG